MTDNNIKARRKSRRGVLLRVCKYLFAHKWLLALAFFLMVTSNVLALVGPYLSGKALDAIELGTGSVDIDTVIKYCILMAVVYIVSGVLSYLLAVLMVHISQKITYSMRKELFDHLTELPIGYFDTHQTGDTVSHISYDIDTVNASLSNDLLQICASIITVVGSFVMMVKISPVLLSVFLFTVPVSIIFTRYKTIHIRPYFRRRSAKLGELNGYAEEMLSGQKAIRVYGREDVITGRFDVKNGEACDAYYDADYHGAVIGPAVNFINNLSISFITMLGGILYMLTLIMGASLHPMLRVALSDVGTFVQYSRKFAGPINEFANILSEIQSATSAAERVFNLMDEAPEPLDAEDAVVLSDVQGKVDIDHVYFGYVPGKTIIKDFNLNCKPGSTIAIVGPTGAGKTTVINLLMRFYDIDRGAIYVDGNEIRQVTRDSLRLSYTMVLQETWLFCGTVYENIAYGRIGATREEVIAAAKAARIHSYIETLPDGYNTVLSDDGVNISKGQKQLLTIARAMLSDSPMLILDEATSNVDSRTEILIGEAMNELMKGRTCFVIAHRLSTIQNADRILVIRNGNIEEQGTHDELMRAKGFYASLYNAQFE